MWNSLTCRSETRSVLRLPLNKFYNYAVTFCLVGQLLVIYLPFLQSVFQTEALSIWDLLYISLLGSVIVIANEARFFLESGSFASFTLKKKTEYYAVDDQINHV